LNIAHIAGWGFHHCGQGQLPFANIYTIVGVLMFTSSPHPNASTLYVKKKCMKLGGLLLAL
jgi:hypothetical protein